MIPLRQIVLVMAAVWMLSAVLLAWRVSAVAKAADENRRLIAQVEANYASNADFRRLCK